MGSIIAHAVCGGHTDHNDITQNVHTSNQKYTVRKRSGGTKQDGEHTSRRKVTSHRESHKRTSSPMPNIVTDGCPVCRMAPTFGSAIRWLISRGTAVKSTTMMGFLAAAAAWLSSCDWDSVKEMLAASCPSDAHERSVPVAPYKTQRASERQPVSKESLLPIKLDCPCTPCWCRDDLHPRAGRGWLLTHRRRSRMSRRSCMQPRQ